MSELVPTSPTAEERKQWWLLCYAFTSMEKAVCSCQLIESLCSDNRHPLFGPLTVAIHAYYARPFKKNKGVGRLSDDVVPNDRMGVHRWLEHFRDCVFSHTDSNHSDVANRPMHDVVYFIDSDGKGFSTSDPLPKIETYRDAEKHCAGMAKIFRSKIIDFEMRFSDFMPLCSGDYLMNLDESFDLFAPHTLPIQGILHYS